MAHRLKITALAASLVSMSSSIKAIGSNFNLTLPFLCNVVTAGLECSTFLKSLNSHPFMSLAIKIIYQKNLQ